jgi:hypothetical protein
MTPEERKRLPQYTETPPTDEEYARMSPEERQALANRIVGGFAQEMQEEMFSPEAFRRMRRRHRVIELVYVSLTAVAFYTGHWIVGTIMVLFGLIHGRIRS